MMVNGPFPNHIAFIMDGNGRWAKAQGKKRIFGHYHGARRLREIIEFGVAKKIGAMSFFAFGADNWKRPAAEVSYIWGLVKRFLTKKAVDWFMENDVAFRWIGFEREAIPRDAAASLKAAQQKTEGNSGTAVNLFMNYSGRADIVSAANALRGQKHPITEKQFDDSLMTQGLGDVDLLIRTGGEERISNFMLWQISYAEIVFCKRHWPEFDVPALLECVGIFARRERRFGGV